MNKAYFDAMGNCSQLFSTDLVAYRLSLRPILDKVIGGSQKIIHLKVDRTQIFKLAMSFYKNSRSNMHEQLMVTFETDGLEEEALDGGGMHVLVCMRAHVY